MNKESGEPLRVLMITKSRQNRGSYMRLFPFASSLAKKGCEVTFLFAQEFRGRALKQTRAEDGLTLISLPSYSDETTAPMVLVRAFQIARFMLKKLRQTEYDLVHVCSPAFPDTWIASLLAKIANVPLLVDIDDLWGFTSDDGRQVSEAVVEEAFIRYGVRIADKVVVASEFLKHRYERISPSGIDILWNGIEPEIFSSHIKTEARQRLERSFDIQPEKKIVLVVLDGPRLTLITAAIEKLKKKGLEFALLLPGWLPDVYKSEVGGDYVKEGDVYRLRRMRRDDYLDLLAGSDMVLFLMEETEWEKARFVIKIPEFLASGTPLISAPVGESRNVIRAAGYSNEKGAYFARLDADSVASALEGCIRDGNRASVTADRARNYVMGNLTWEHLTSQLLRIYSNMVAVKSNRNARS